MKGTGRSFMLCVLLFSFIVVISSAPLEPDSDSIEIPVKPKKKFSIFGQPDDAIFNFVKKIVDTANLSTKSALKRVSNHSEKLKELEGEIAEVLAGLEGYPKLPFVDKPKVSK